ncbi:PREDICTED: general transcription factor IIH subunit 2-like isoform X2 [Priapulus caudatus]|uniref:General transcription factor IIH subunit n=1 Tax=Priapulus caudatus TaxID=37621 RepID=A0ABM1DRA5_PRICU|nr:PREDICTED: general transcription factor IIH subunit 2-like isoform X2 [Priapulus caudatus]
MDEDGETETGAYIWEGEYEKTWEALREDEAGSIQASVDDIVSRAKRRRLLERPADIRLGMMRHLFVVIDLSSAMTDQDLRPTRQHCTLKLLEGFIEEYFDQNPISQLGLVVTRNKSAEKLTELGGNPQRHITAARKAVDMACSGEPSLQNSLEICMKTLRYMPGHTSREILIILGSLTTCDPGDVSKTIKELASYNIRSSVIGLAAEVRVCAKLCKGTRGKYGVILDECHFKDILMQHVSPPPAATNTESSLVRMGFPYHQLSANVASGETPSMCMCHLDGNEEQGFGSKGYFCPQCKGKYCELPVECKSCGLTLVSAPHLARSYHHLFPLDASVELKLSNISAEVSHCYACQVRLTEQLLYQCQKCQKFFCLDCDLFIHETLHSCPGCANKPPNQALNDSVNNRNNT